MGKAEEQIIYKTLNMVNFDFVNRPVDEFENSERCYVDIEQTFQDIIDIALNKNSTVFLNIDYSSDGGDLQILFVLLDKFRQLKALGVIINVNIVGSLASAGAYLLLALAKEKLCTFKYDKVYNDILFMIHTGAVPISTRHLNNKNRADNANIVSIKKMNKKLLELSLEYIDMTKEDIDKFNNGLDLFYDFDEILEKFEKEGLVINDPLLEAEFE